MKTINKYCIAAGIFMLTMAMFSPVKAQVKDQKEEARLFVQKFYDWYNKLYNVNPADFKHKYPDGLVSYTFRNQSQHFDKVLLNAYLAYDKPELRKANAVVGLDFDPMLNALNNELDYQTGAVKQVANGFYIDIHRGTKGKSRSDILKEHINIIAEVRKEGNNWKFVNVSYPPPDGVGNDLVSILRTDKGMSEDYNASHKARPQKK